MIDTRIRGMRLDVSKLKHSNVKLDRRSKKAIKRILERIISRMKEIKEREE